MRLCPHTIKNTFSLIICNQEPLTVREALGISPIFMRIETPCFIYEKEVVVLTLDINIRGWDVKAGDVGQRESVYSSGTHPQ